MADAHGSRWLRPRYIFAVVALVVLATVLFAPAGEVGAYSSAITTYSARPYGARGLYEVAERLGWRVERRVAPLDSALDSRAVYMILAPPNPLSAVEVGTLLEAVRSGARALVAPSVGTPLADSLGVHLSRMSAFGWEVTGGPDSVGDRTPAAQAIVDAAAAAGSFDFVLETDSAMHWSASTLVRVEKDDSEEPGMMSLRVGRGEVVVLADAGFFRNLNVRNGSSAVFAIRVFEWLDPEKVRAFVFDEYHQGFGERASMSGTILDALLHTAPGRVLLQLVVAGLILLLVYGVRPIAPLKRHSIERRSPLEHVGALARAYQQAEATRTSTQRLLRGLRRRRPLGATGALDDDSYLSFISARKPELAADVNRVRAALARPLPAEEWVAVGAAIDHIERTIAQ
jgi:hypothetical protein